MGFYSDHGPQARFVPHIPEGIHEITFDRSTGRPQARCRTCHWVTPHGLDDAEVERRAEEHSIAYVRRDARAAREASGTPCRSLGAPQDAPPRAAPERPVTQPAAEESVPTGRRASRLVAAVAAAALAALTVGIALTKLGVLS